MTFEPNFKFTRKHPATNNHLENTKIGVSETTEFIAKTVSSSGQFNQASGYYPLSKGKRS